MGKINQPTQQSNETRVSTELSQGVIHDDSGLDEAKEVSQSRSDELNLTNEAIRLIGLKQQLGIDASSSEYDSELKGILQWAREKGIKNKNQLSATLREIQYKLGFSEPKEGIKNIYNHIRLDGQIKSLVNQQEMLRAKGK